jgi:enamine deaminase RidA (YjgF/YER057c/UK114 family)
VTSRYGSGGPYETAVGYSRLVVSGDTARTAGCTAIAGSDVVGPDDPYVQTLTAFAVGLDALAGAGFTVSDVVQTRMYVVDVQRHHAEVGRAHRELFDAVRPAATMVGIQALIRPELLVEIELVAVRDPAGEPA